MEKKHNDARYIYSTNSCYDVEASIAGRHSLLTTVSSFYLFYLSNVLYTSQGFRRT